MTQVSLSAEEKISIINSHIKNIQFAKYNAEVSIIEENSVASPNANSITAFMDIITKSDMQIAALQLEIDALSA